MTRVNVLELANSHLTHAMTNGRHSQTLHGGRDHDLRQTLICLAEGHELGEHESPGEATVQVLVGAIDLVAGDDATRLSPGDYLIIPPHRHAVRAASDSAFLLTVATRADRG